jgi:hypothetical protein
LENRIFPSEYLIVFYEFCTVLQHRSKIDDTYIYIFLSQADWKALHGALVGCLALMRRKSTAGMVTGTDAKAAAQSYLQNLQVQSLGQHDRKVIVFLSLN